MKSDLLAYRHENVFDLRVLIQTLIMFFTSCARHVLRTINRNNLFSSNMDRLLNNRHFKFGLPLVLFIVGSSFGLKYYSQLKYDVQKERHVWSKTKELREKIGPVKEKSLEEEYAELRKTVDIDNWKNIRGPRPWETDNMEYKELIEKRAEESKNQWVFSK